MKVQATVGEWLCADGKFFREFNIDPVDHKPIYRQVELYLPCAPGTYGEPIETTMNRWMEDLQSGKRETRWAIGSTGGQLTARYKLRESDGELVSLLALSGGMQA